MAIQVTESQMEECSHAPVTRTNFLTPWTFFWWRLPGWQLPARFESFAKHLRRRPPGSGSRARVLLGAIEEASSLPSPSERRIWAATERAAARGRVPEPFGAAAGSAASGSLAAQPGSRCVTSPLTPRLGPRCQLSFSCHSRQRGHRAPF